MYNVDELGGPTMAKIRGCRITVIIPVFQTGDGGSTPPTRSNKQTGIASFFVG